MTPAYEHNGQPVSAETFYAIACDPRRHVAVEACAGAGKTWILVSRIVRALLDGIAPQDILAITFTKRAAGEMRERLQQWLTEFSTADSATLTEELALRGIVVKSAASNPGELQDRLANLGASVLASGRQVQIRTFHGWFAALLRNAPLALLQQLGLPANYELLEDDKDAKAQVWRRFYAALIDDTALRTDFEAVVFDYGRFQAERALQAALDKRLEFGLADAAGVVDTSVLHFSQQFPGFEGLDEPGARLQHPASLHLLREAAAALGRASAPSYSAAGVKLAEVLGAAEGDEPIDVDAAQAALLTKDGTARKFSEKIIGIDRVRVAQALVLQVQAAQQQHAAWLYQQRMARLSRLLIAEFAALKRERGWVDMNDVERAASLMLGDTVLAGWLQQRLDARVKQVLIDEFQDTSPLQWQALFSWLSGYAGAGGGGSGANAPGVFIVGDPKQSIYRFRRAEPQVFKAAKAFVHEGLGGDVLSCDHTRRNAPQIVDAVNAVMLEAMAGTVEGDVYDGFRRHTTGSTAAGELCRLPQISRADAAVKADALEDDVLRQGAWRDSLTVPQVQAEETLRVQEARQAATWIARLIGKGRLAKDIMVLSRRRASLAPLHEALRALQIPSQIGEKTALIDCCEVQDIVALLDVLVSPQHDLSLARVLKSPLFGLDDAALIQIALRQQEAGGSWFEVLLNQEQTNAIFCRPIAVLTQWKVWVDDLPPHDALQAIYTDGDVLARFAAAAPAPQRAAVLANLRALPGVALQQGGGRFATPYAFVRALKAGGIQASAAVLDNAVRLLTIHGAKGLEAEVVLLLDSDATPPRAESMGVLVDWPGGAAQPHKFVFLASENQPPACATLLLQRDLRERQREELNALYVALTRAISLLAVSSVAPHRPSPGSWWARLSPLARPLTALELHGAPPGAVPTSGTPSANSSSADKPTVDRPAVLMKILPKGPSIKGEAASEVPSDVQGEVQSQVKSEVKSEAKRGAALALVDSPESRVGQAMHRLLEWGAGEALAALANDADAYANAHAGVHAAAQAELHPNIHANMHGNLHAVAREFGLTPDQVRTAAALAERILQGEGAWAWDASKVAWQGNEVELLHNGVTLRLDRLVQRQGDGAWWVLDYKSASNPLADPALRAQLASYRLAVQAVYPQATVRAAFLTGDGKLQEWVGSTD